MQQPTVYIVFGADGFSPSACAFEVTGEILETVEFLDNGQPDWANAGICDHRGGGGSAGFAALAVALGNAEQNQKLMGNEVVRVPKEVE